MLSEDSTGISRQFALARVCPSSISDLLVSRLPSPEIHLSQPHSRGHVHPMNLSARMKAWIDRWLLIVLAVFATTAFPALWLADHLCPRSEYFVQRRGRLVSAHVRPDPPSGAAFRSETVCITADTGLTVELRVLRPARQSRPLPLVVLLGGHRTGRNAIDVVGDPGELVVAALDYPYHGPEKVRGWRQAIAALPLIQRGLLDTPPAISLAVDWLERQPWVARQQIEIVGVSLGAPFAATAGALDRRFRRVWIIHGGADIRGWIEHNLQNQVRNAWLRARAATLVYLLAYGRSFESTKWVGCIAPRPLIIIGAKDDERLPRPMVERLYAAAGEPKELIWTEGGHINPGQPEIVRQLLEIVRGRIGAGIRPVVSAAAAISQRRAIARQSGIDRIHPRYGQRAPPIGPRFVLSAQAFRRRITMDVRPRGHLLT
jgi:fermentation-respiration switch protein FrsA (DUF1100 family)